MSFYNWKKIASEFLSKFQSTLKIPKCKIVRFTNGKISVSSDYHTFITFNFEKDIQDILNIQLEEIKFSSNVTENKQKDVEKLLNTLGVDDREDIQKFYNIKK